MKLLSSLGVAAALSGCMTHVPDIAPAMRAELTDPAKANIGHLAATPLGYFEMCARDPNLCRVRNGNLPATADGSVKVAPGTMDQLASVNASVNAAIRPAHRDDWTPDQAVGDCKDFAMTKRQRLIDMGWPSSAVPVAVVRTASGAEHLIVVARTDQGNFVLDNLTQTVVPSPSVSYSWEKILSPTNLLEWRAL
jgi:predicted transglutaminase-like cysteine proteinase